MTSTPMPNLASATRPAPLLRPSGWAWVALCTVLFGWMHWEFVYRTYLFSKDPNWSHVLIIPVIAGYFVVQNKQRLQEAPKRLAWWALPFVFVGLYSYLWWIYPGRNDMFRGYSMIFTLFATVMFLLGPATMRVLWFPIAYMVFAVKISDAIWSRVAEHLQDVASVGATFALQFLAEFMNFSVENDGNVITLGFFKNGAWVHEGMNVAEACAGLRMLMAFIALGVALAFMFNRAWWQRVVMISLAVPIAVLVNIGRVTALGVIYTIDKSYAQGDFHIFIGMLMLIPAAGLFLLVGWILDQIVVRDENAASPPSSAKQTTAAVGGWAAGKIKTKPTEPQPTAAEANASAAPFDAAVIAKGLLLGASLALISGLSYAMFFNAFSARPLIEAIPPGVSLGLLGFGLVMLVVLWQLARKLAPRNAPGSAAPRSAAAENHSPGQTTADSSPSPKRRAAAPNGPAVLTYATALIAGIFAAAAAGQYSVIHWQKAVLHKEAVALRHDLLDLPLDKGPYVFLSDETLPPEIVDELGTEEYLSRWYIDTRIEDGQPGQRVRLHVAYYTGLVDTVPHVPDRCFVAGGAKHKGLHNLPIRLDPSIIAETPDGPGYQAQAVIAPPGADPYGPGTVASIPQRDITATRFTYGSEQSNNDNHVVYFFAANGKFLQSPNDVRYLGFDIRDAHSYYCKIEVQIFGETDPDKVAERTTEVLNVFLPEIMACLPDWNDVKAGRWPIDDDEQTPADTTH